MKKIGLIVFAAAIIFGVVIANFISFGKTTEKVFNFSIDSEIGGSGNIVTQKRDLNDFTGIDVGGVFEVEVVSQKDFSVEIDADDNLLPLIKTEVRNGVLRISTDEEIKSKNTIRVRISAPDVDSIGTSGVAKVSLTDVKNSDLKIDASGASKVTVAGETANLSVEISGASHLNAEGLRAENAGVDASGASHVNVNVLEQLKAGASGASKINYTGSPKSAEKNSSGASSINNK
ncbi:MAG: DUF2807 domain-containing protein [Saprospiraceae bacterium]|nr:DUF2807 domain-containing protein [Pyrinomonadaceae bacterium]